MNKEDKNYSHLVLEERKEIESLLRNSEALTQVALKLKRTRATIYKEVNRNGGRDKYNAIEAQRLYDQRKDVIIAKMNYQKSGIVNIHRKKIESDIHSLGMQMEIVLDFMKDIKKRLEKND